MARFRTARQRMLYTDTIEDRKVLYLYYYKTALSGGFIMAEKVRFELTVPFGYGRFQVCCFRPLSHLSVGLAGIKYVIRWLLSSIAAYLPPIINIGRVNSLLA